MARHSATAVKRRSRIRRQKRKQQYKINQEQASSGYREGSTTDSAYYSENTSICSCDSVTDCREQTTNIVEEGFCHDKDDSSCTSYSVSSKTDTSNKSDSVQHSSVEYIMPNVPKNIATRFRNRLNMTLDSYYDKDPLAAAFCDLNTTVYKAAFIQQAANLSKY